MHLQTALLIAVLAGLGGMLGWGLADFFAKKTIDQIGDIPTLAWAHVCGSGIVLIALGVRLVTTGTAGLPHSSLAWLALVGFGILQGIIYLLVYRAFSKGKVSVLNPIFASYSGIAALAVIIFFGEPLGALRGLALLLIFVSVLVLSIEDGPISLRVLRQGGTAGLGEIATATLLAGGWTVGWDRFVHNHDWLVYAALMYIAMTAAIVGIASAQGVKLRQKAQGVWRYVFLIGLTEVGAYASISLGFSRSNHAAIVALLSGSFSVPTIILARCFLGERINRYQFGGIVAIVVGVIVIAVA
jgi:drug/metabolite transporter (DMT)-like permease